MKKIVWLIVLALVATYLVPAVTLSQNGANRFLNDLEHLSLTGKVDEYCEKLDDEMEVSIQDHSATPEARIEGGKQELCDYISTAAKGMSLLGISTHFTRDEFTVKRAWLHPWTAEVSYNEQRTTNLSLVNTTLRTESEDHFTLVQTLGGVRVKRLKSEVWLAR